MDPEYLTNPPAGIFEPVDTDMALKIAVIGAGIAGLAAAAGLTRAGHRVEVFEKSRFSNEVGAAINVCPNASRVLDYWGFDFQRAKQVPFENGRVVRGDNFDAIHEASYKNWPIKYGAEGYFLHRADLHNGLKTLALESTPDFQAAKLNLSSEVVDVDSKTGLVTLANGKSSQYDVVVVADGVHSRFVSKVIGHQILAKATGHSAFRFLIPTQKLLAFEDLRPLFENASPCLTVSTLGDRRLIWYPCRSGELQNFVGIHPENEAGTDKEEWNVEAPLEKLLATYQDFNPTVTKICEQAEDLKLWKLLFRAPISSWTKDRLVLIGDAAHPMLPHQGQGGGQAIEDGGALGALFSHIRSMDEIPQRLHLFEEVRKNRASAMQMFSNAGQDEGDKIEESARPYVKGQVPKTVEDYHDYNFGYNVFRECTRILETSGRQLKL